MLVHIGTSIIMRKFGLHIPGHSGLIWMPLLVVGKVRWPTRISGIYMAFASSLAVLLITPVIGIQMMGTNWMFPFLKYGIPGLALDMLWPLSGKLPTKSLASLIAATGVAALSYSTKVLFVLLSCYLFDRGLPADLITLIFLHFAFGAAGGVIGTLIGHFGLKEKAKISD